jgi:membrane protein implicated in regulation of membrane protease activity
VYLGVSAAAISVGLLSDAFALPTAITIVAAAIALVAIPGAVWHLSQRNRPPELQLTSGVSAV